MVSGLYPSADSLTVHPVSSSLPDGTVQNATWNCPALPLGAKLRVLVLRWDWCTLPLVAPSTDGAPATPAYLHSPRGVREPPGEFGPLSPTEPQRRHFAEYLTGLYVAARKTVTGINAEFARTTDPSCLNSYFSPEALRKG